MWAKLSRWLASFDEAIVVAIDPNGFPVATRCRAVADPAHEVLALTPEQGQHLRPGPAGLLCHSHDARIWDLRSFHVHGQLRRDGDAWTFAPTRLIHGSGLAGLRGDLSLALGAQREAVRYLARRGLSAPRIDWQEIDAGRREGATLFAARTRGREP